MNNSNLGIVIQARVGSTRLPSKVIQPFYKGVSILGIILKRIKISFPKIPIVVATTISENDNDVCEIAQSEGVANFRGSEEDVLDRMIKAAQANNIISIVRVCADNPLLSMELMKTLIQNYSGEDYLSFQMSDGTPVIKSHLGLFAEMTNIDALLLVQKLTNDALYNEHVTNFLYGHPESFNIKWLELPALLGDRKDLRFTIDTASDFRNVQHLYSELDILEYEDYNIEQLIQLVANEPKILASMMLEIQKNSK